MRHTRTHHAPLSTFTLFPSPPYLPPYSPLAAPPLLTEQCDATQKLDVPTQSQCQEVDTTCVLRSSRPLVRSSEHTNLGPKMPSSTSADNSPFAAVRPSRTDMEHAEHTGSAGPYRRWCAICWICASRTIPSGVYKDTPRRETEPLTQLERLNEYKLIHILVKYQQDVLLRRPQARKEELEGGCRGGDYGCCAGGREGECRSRV